MELGQEAHGLHSDSYPRGEEKNLQAWPIDFTGSVLKVYLFNVWLCWVFVAAHGLSPVAESRGFSWRAQALGSRHVGFSNWGSWALQFGLRSCGAQA